MAKLTVNRASTFETYQGKISGSPVLLLLAIAVLLADSPMASAANHFSNQSATPFFRQIAEKYNAIAPASRRENPRRCFATSPSVCIFESELFFFGLDQNESYKKAQLLAEIALKYAEAGQFERALQLAQTLEVDSLKASALVEIAAEFVAAGRSDKAEPLFSQVMQIIQSVKYNLGAVGALQRIARQLAAVGKTELYQVG